MNKKKKISEVLDALQAQPLTESVEGDIGGCYISDLLSDVLAHADPDMLWVTIHRITSYNVCYTKLLRFRHPAGGRRSL